MSTGSRHLGCLKCGKPIFVDTDKEPQLCIVCQSAKKHPLSDEAMEAFIKEQLHIMRREISSKGRK